MRFRVLLSIVVSLCFTAVSLADEEFLGPFSSWADVKRDFGAIGDGKADDTAAIQRGLDALQHHKTYCVLFIPSGTYRITATLRTTRKAHTDYMTSIIGEDPATTTIRWEGPKDGVLFYHDAWYAKISRLTLDGAGKAKIALGYGDGFSTYNETSDMVFKDVALGIFLGMGTAGQAENAVLRCKFLRCSEAGVCTTNFNSMDIWVWNSLFEDCGYGLHNKAGNFHVYHNLFYRSKIMDIGTNNLMVFAIVNNTSIGSKCFLDWRSQMIWGAPTAITGNRIIDPVDDIAMHLGNGGPFLVMDNIFKGRTATKTPQIEMTWGDQTFVGNTYTSTNPLVLAGRRRSIDGATVDPLTIDRSPPRQPPTPRRFERTVFEVDLGSDAVAIQRLIDEAAGLKGKRPVVHIPMGKFRIDRTLQIPDASDLQLVGDGASEIATVLEWAGKAGEPMLRLAGPARASIRDLYLAAGNGIGIVAEECDQRGGKVFADQLNVTGISPTVRSSTGVWLDGIEESDVQLRDLQGGSSMANWIKVTGGTKQRAGVETKGQNSVFCGATGSSDSPYTVEKGGKLVVRSVYHELDQSSGSVPTALKLKDSGTLNIDTTRFSYKTSPQAPLIDCQGMRGSFAMTSSFFLPVNSTYPGWIQLQGSGSDSNALLLDCLFWSPEKPTTSDIIWRNDTKPPANAAMLECNQNGQSKDNKGFFEFLPERSAPNNDDLIRQALAPLRTSRIWQPSKVESGLTDLSLHRVIIRSGTGGVGIILKATR